MRAIRNTGVDFDAQFCVWRKRKSLARKRKQIFNLLGSEIRRRSAAPMKLHNRSRTRNAEADSINFLFQNIEIRRRNFFIFLNDYVARAKQAQALAEGNVHVEGNWCARSVSFGVNFLEIVDAEGVVPDGCGGIASVARSGAIVAG